MKPPTWNAPAVSSLRSTGRCFCLRPSCVVAATAELDLLGTVKAMNATNLLSTIAPTASMRLTDPFLTSPQRSALALVGLDNRARSDSDVEISVDGVLRLAQVLEVQPFDAASTVADFCCRLAQEVLTAGWSPVRPTADLSEALLTCEANESDLPDEAADALHTLTSSGLIDGDDRARSVVFVKSEQR